MTNQSEVLTRKEASDFLKVPIRTVDFLVATGQIPFSRLGRRRVIFLRDRLLEYLRDREGVQYSRVKK